MIRFWKSGYPLRPPTIVPELPVLSLGLHQGNQIIVSEASATGADATPSGGTGSYSIPPRAAPSRSATSVPSRSAPTRASVAAPAPIPKPSDSGPDTIQVGGSFLVHRVRVYLLSGLEWR